MKFQHLFWKDKLRWEGVSWSFDGKNDHHGMAEGQSHTYTPTQGDSWWCVSAVRVLSSTWSTGTLTGTVCSRRQWSRTTDWLLLESFLRYTTHTSMRTHFSQPCYTMICRYHCIHYVLCAAYAALHCNSVMPSWQMSDPCVGWEETWGATETGGCSACYQT